MEEIKRIADRVSVLRDGKLIATVGSSEVTTADIVKMMVGRDLSSLRTTKSRQKGKLALCVKGLSTQALLKDVSFDLQSGEILGFAGLMGSGRTETMRAIFGADKRVAGEIYRSDLNKPLTIGEPRDAVRAGQNHQPPFLV